MKKFIAGALCFFFLLTPSAAALRFDGINGKVDCGNAAELVPYPMTYETWMKTTTSGGGEGLASSYDLAQYGWRVYILGASIYGAYEVTSSRSAKCTFNAATFTDGAWHHIAFTVDAGGCTAYTDGVQDDAQSWLNVAGAASNTLPFVFGERTWGKGVSYYAGDLDETRLWKDVRTPEEINAYMYRVCSGTELDLAGYWRLDEGTGTNAVDLQDNATRNLGTHTGGVTHVDGAPKTYGE